MSFGYRVLAVAFAGVLVIVGLAGIIDGGDSGGSIAGASATTATNAPAATSASDSTSAPASAGAPTSATASSAPGEVADPCGVSSALRRGSASDEVICLEQQLSAAGYFTGPVDTTFDDATDQAVRAYQGAMSLEVDGVVGRQTAQSLGIWTGPLGPLPASDEDCPDTPHGAIVDRANQRGALCADGAITHEFPITTAWTQPDPGTYPVYAKDLRSSSNFGGHYSTMTHFVSFAEGKYTGARIAFHSVPKLSDGTWVQPLDTVGSEAYHGESSGCIRVLPDDAVLIWDWLSIGDEVHVTS